MNLLLHGKYPDDVNQTNEEGETPLIIAAKYDFSILNTLLKRPEIEINQQDKKGNTALHYAIFNNGKRRINALLTNKNINIDIPNNLGQTARELYEGQEICVIS